MTPFNTPIAVVYGLVALAFLAHMTGGLRESLTVDPNKQHKPGQEGATPPEQSNVQVQRNWVQLMCAFQLVSVDLLALATVLYLLAFTEVLAPAQQIAYGVAAVFFLYGTSWLIQIATLKRPAMDFLYLGHWSIWYLCAGLVYWGAGSL